MNVFIGKDNKEWGRFISNKLKIVGKNQNDLAKEIGVSRGSVSLYLSGDVSVSLQTVRNIEVVLMKWELEYAEVKS